jgi:type I restriction enzyme M protein
MTADHLKGLEAFEGELWKIAADLRANSNLASNEYFMPIMGLLFLRQATNRYYAALEVIEADKVAGRMPKRPPVAADFARRRALMLAPSARFDEILKNPKDGNLGGTLIAAMEEIERAYQAKPRRIIMKSRTPNFVMKPIRLNLERVQLGFS